jgi:hypothetical protein
MMLPQIAQCPKTGTSPCPIHEQPNCKIGRHSLEKEDNEQDHLLESGNIKTPKLNARRKEIAIVINTQQVWYEAII